jgi:hypothetical protein
MGRLGQPIKSDRQDFYLNGVRSCYKPLSWWAVPRKGESGYAQWARVCEFRSTWEMRLAEQGLVVGPSEQKKSWANSLAQSGTILIKKNETNYNIIYNLQFIFNLFSF